MANEFVIKNGYLSRGDSEITGSLIVTGGITGSLLGTASTASYVDLVAGPNITINQVGTSFEISGSGGGGGDTNFANTDLTFTGTRTHDLSGNSLSLLNGSSITLSGSGGFNNILLKHDTNQVYVQSSRTSFNPVNADINFQVGTVGTDYALNVDGGTDRVSINKNLPNATLDVNGDTIISGSLNVTASFTASGLNYPDTDGVDRQVIKTDGLGNLTFGYPEEIVAVVKNVSGGTLLKGTPVHATESGAMGNVVGIIAASASDASTMPATFVLNETLADEAEGEALASGFIQGVNTSGFEVGQVVYVGESGGYTSVKPTGSNLIQNLGIVTKVDATNGSGFVLGAGRANDVPNILEGYAWIGNSDGVAIPTPTSSIQNVVSSSFASTVPTGVGGIYGGNGTVPLNTTASINGDFTFQGLDEDTRLIVRDGNNGSAIHLFSDGPAGQAGVEFRTQTTDTLLHRIQIAGGDTRYQANQRDLVFSTSTGSLSSGIFITASNGDVGIGTVTPNYKLDVNGTTNINGNTTITGSLVVSGSNTKLETGLTTKTYRLTAASYTASASDYRIAVRYTDTGSVAIQLPLISEVGELEYKFKDEEGNAQLNHITITTSGSDLIDGDSNAILNRNYMAIGLYNDGVSNWYIE